MAFELGRTRLIGLGVLFALIVCLPHPALAGSSSVDSNWEKDPSAWQVAIYPIYAWVPVFGASVKIPAPPLPSNPVAGEGTASGTTSGSLNGAAFVGAEILKSKWSVTANALWAGLSGDRDTPRAHIGLDVIYGQLMAGREIVPTLSLEGGFRRMTLNLNASVDDSSGHEVSGSAKPGFWDPLIGMTWRKHVGNWQFRTHFDGGGFGVGSDVSLGASLLADWRFAKHFGVAMGGGALHFQETSTISEKSYTVRQTVYGPVFGFGIYF